MLSSNAKEIVNFMSEFTTSTAKKIYTGGMDESLKSVYGYSIEHQQIRYAKLAQSFEEYFCAAPEGFYSAPGRSELVGNHTDHQRGRVIAASVDMDIIAAVKKRSDNAVRIFSEGFGLIEADLSNLEKADGEEGTTQSLIRGIAFALKDKGIMPFGFDAYMVSDVPAGSGVSSSAAFEILVGNIFCEGAEDSMRVFLAQAGQFAENKYFGKPSGLMDQLASSLGGITYIDFHDASAPQIENIPFDIGKAGYNLCIVDTHSSHADLTNEYSDIFDEMKQVASYYGKEVLSEVSTEAFYSDFKKLREILGDRAVLRAMHFFEETERVRNARDILKKGDIDAFLDIIDRSGRSSFMYLQNAYPTGSIKEQGLAPALAVTEKLLGGKGAFRVHGGGFAGTIQAFVPTEMTAAYKTGIEKVLGEGSCRVVKIRKAGGARLELK